MTVEGRPVSGSVATAVMVSVCVTSPWPGEMPVRFTVFCAESSKTVTSAIGSMIGWSFGVINSIAHEPRPKVVATSWFGRAAAAGLLRPVF